MGRKPLSSYPPEVAAKMRADISKKARKAWAERDSNGLALRKNGAFRSDVQQRIAIAVRRQWKNGAYADRRNGMLGKFGSKHASWAWGRVQYAEILQQHEAKACRYCGAREHVNAHHIDENHDNYLLTNLVWVCVPCHMWRFHYDKSPKHPKHTKAPFITIGRRFSFEYAHILPWHPGKCARLHGHSGHLNVEVRGRVDPNGVVMDFSELKADVQAAVVKPLDHQMLNDFIPNPSSEEMLIWAWMRLESIGLKGLVNISFEETDSSWTRMSAADMYEAYGWDVGKGGKWLLGRKKVVAV